MLLVPSETEAATAYTIYLNMQTSTGRGTGSALAVLAVGVVALATDALAGLLGRRARCQRDRFGPCVFPQTNQQKDMKRILR